ncbi:hypothetical protein [Streptomyces sp.]|nr:hypothetical protein [Streptomyces sp.]HET6357774.1 hypothetical protein [Streptomyces sp.]
MTASYGTNSATKGGAARPTAEEPGGAAADGAVPGGTRPTEQEPVTP